MKSEFDNMKGMPYRESDEYLDKLVARCTEEAIQRGTKPTQRKSGSLLRGLGSTRWPAWRMMAAAAAVVMVAVLFFAGKKVWVAHENTLAVAQVQEESPLDEFLNSLSDEDVQLLAYYEVEDIPEY